jgi:hypothetical protein
MIGKEAAFALSYEEVKLTAPDPIQNAEFGRSVAMDGSRLVVGAAEGSDEVAYGPGAAYVFKRSGDSYELEAKLVAPDPTDGAEFGRSVAVKGNLVVVGARFASIGGIERAGTAYIYTRTAGEWRFVQKLAADFPSSEGNFGRAVALDNNLLVVTARKEDINSGDEGSAYVFFRNGQEWILEARLEASDPTAEARFGQPVAVKGNLIATGARRADPEGNENAGAVYFFGLYGQEWREIQKLTADDSYPGDEFGHSVAMSGNAIAVGARRANIDENEDQGAIYIFSKRKNRWDQKTKITASDGNAGDELAHSICAYGQRIAVGANLADIDEEDQGAVYIYRLHR